MNRWIKLETSLMEDPRIMKLLDSNLRYEGLGIYIALRLMLENQISRCLHINKLRLMCNKTVGFNKINHVINDFDLFWIDGNGSVSLRVCDGTRDGTRDGTPHDASEPLGLEEKRKEIDKENFEENNPLYSNGNHDFDPRWS